MTTDEKIEWIKSNFAPVEIKEPMKNNFVVNAGGFWAGSINGLDLAIDLLYNDIKKHVLQPE